MQKIIIIKNKEKIKNKTTKGEKEVYLVGLSH